MPKRKTTEQFVAEAIEKHGEGRYSYLNTEYNGSHNNLEIYCIPCSKQISIRASHHLEGQGCADCSHKNHRSNTDEFIKKSKKIHKGKYSYEYTEYEYATKKLKVYCICCSKDFFITPNNHLSGKGCPSCGKKKRNIKRKKKPEQFVVDATQKHGEGRYNFKNTNYENAIKKVRVYCNSCKKEFSIKPNNLLNGRGCPGCCNKTEGKLFNMLSEMFPSLLRQFKQEWCKNITHLPFDFCIPEYNIIIELDGPQHFRQVSNWRSPEEQFKIDMYKEECANDNGYSLIRLVQEDVLNDSYDWMSYLLSSIEEIRQSPEIMNMYLCRNGEYDKY